MIRYIVRRPLFLFALLGYGILFAHVATSQQDTSSVVEATQQRVKKVIIFDVGGVLVTHSEGSLYFKVAMRALKQQGFSLLFGLGDLNRAAIQPLFFAILDAAAEYPATLERMYDDHDQPCPKGLCALNAGLITLEELKANALKVIATMVAEDKKQIASGCPRIHFKSKVQARFIRTIIETIFDNTTLAQSCKKLAGAKILRTLLERSDIEVMILSNFAVEQFAAVTEYMPKIFNGIPKQNIFVSGMELPAAEFGTAFDGSLYKLAVKPNKSTFEAMKQICKKRWGVNPYDIIMIDNQRKNIQAAQNSGMVAYLVNSETEGTAHNHTFDELQNALIRDLSPADNRV